MSSCSTQFRRCSLRTGAWGTHYGHQVSARRSRQRGALKVAMVEARAKQVTLSSRRYAVSRTGLCCLGPSWAAGTPGRAHLLRSARAGLRIDTRGNTAECSRRVLRFPAAARHALLRGQQPAGPDTTDVAARIAADTDSCEDERSSTLYASKLWLHLVVTPLQTTCRLQGDTSSRTSKPTHRVTSQMCSCVFLAG